MVISIRMIISGINIYLVILGVLSTEAIHDFLPVVYTISIYNKHPINMLTYVCRVFYLDK